jgi:uracil-DNA glycosylase family 4
MGSGSRQSEIMLVGEAPGAREDEEHRAFVGAAGQVLTRMLQEHAGLTRDECYITNVVKCRPPENRTPEKKEVKVCVENYFIKEIQKVNPKYVLLLGNAALNGVVGKSGVTRHRGTRWDLDGMVVMSTFHPAAMLRNPKYGEALASDLMRFGQLIRGTLADPKTEVKIVRTPAHLKWLLSKLAKEPDISYDIETGGGKHWHGGQIASIAFTWEAGQAAFVPLFHDQTPWKDPQVVIDAFAPYLMQKDQHHTGHNGKFDARWLAGYDAPVLQTFDTMIAGHMVDENRPKGLKYLSQILLNADGYELEAVKEGKAHEVPLRKLAVYNGKDTDYTWRLRQIFKKELARDLRVARVFKFLMMPASNVLVDVERRGLQVDFERWKERQEQAVRIRTQIEEIMIRHVPLTKRSEFNFNSPQQVAEWLFHDLGFPVLEETKTGAESTKESVLLQLRKESKLVGALLKWRKWNKYLTTYLGPWAEHMDEHARLHCTYKPHGTVTGRLSSSDPNLQNVPRDPFIRSILSAKKDHLLVAADYSQIELRVAAVLANEKRMLRAFMSGEDLHLKTAAETTGKRPEDITKEERKKAKAVNFGFLFSMGWQKFITYARDNYDVDFEPEEAQRIRERFFESYPALRAWHERQRRLSRRYKRVSSPLGRVRHLPDIDSRDKEVRAEAERQAINSPVQSTASDLMLISMLILHDHGVPIVGTVHDQLLFEPHKSEADEMLPLIKKVMEEDALAFARRKFGTNLEVPIVADIEVGTHWTEGKSWNG